MGQYHLIVNLDRKEYLDPHELASGLKAWEQLASFPASPQALFVLLVCSNGRGGGDLEPHYRPDGERVVGRWAGDRIAVVGDYAEDGDIRKPTSDPVSGIYRLCREGTYRNISEWLRPVLSKELGVIYEPDTWVMEDLQGGRSEHVNWSVRRDPKATFSVLEQEPEPGREKAP